MTPQQTWYSLPVPYAHRPRPVGSRPPGRRRGMVLTVAAVGVGALIVAVIVGGVAPGAPAADPDGPPAPADPTTAGRETAFLDASEAAGLPVGAGRGEVLRVGRATCAQHGGAGPQDTAGLSPAAARRVAELARQHLCPPGQTG